MLAASPLRADDAAKEYYVKAAFIYNFIKFTEWPGEKAIGLQSGINVCTLGGDPFGKAASVFTAASTDKLAIHLVEIGGAAQAKNQCHIVFLTHQRESTLSDDLRELRSSPVLTVSDISDFAGKGGVIGFVMQDGKIKIIVNTKAAEAAGLRLDAQLLEIALSVIH